MEATGSRDANFDQSNGSVDNDATNNQLGGTTRTLSPTSGCNLN